MPIRCRSVLRYPSAISLGQAFANSFAATSSGIGKGEIVLFRAMEASLKAVGSHPGVVVEEYHGAHHQVTFTGSGTYSRTNARCELSDLLVIVYDRQAKYARMSYIQAKSERSVPASVNGIAGSLLAANLEQWDLLARRPSIGGVGSFKPPLDLLKSALLSSIGSFVFFVHAAGGVAVQYAAASRLTRPSASVKRYGKLIIGPDACHCGPHPECVSVYGNAEFGEFLFGMMIGTPILIRGKPVSPPLGGWLAAQLRGLAAMAVANDPPAALANELADLLDPDRAPAAQTPNVGAATLLLFGMTQDGRPD